MNSLDLEPRVYHENPGGCRGFRGPRFGLSAVTERIRREGEIRKSVRTLTTCECCFFFRARQNAEVNELLPVLVAEAELSGRAVLEIEMDPSHPVVDPSSDAGCCETVFVGRLTGSFFGLA